MADAGGGRAGGVEVALADGGLRAVEAGLVVLAAVVFAMVARFEKTTS